MKHFLLLIHPFMHTPMAWPLGAIWGSVTLQHVDSRRCGSTHKPFDQWMTCSTTWSTATLKSPETPLSFTSRHKMSDTSFVSSIIIIYLCLQWCIEGCNSCFSQEMGCVRWDLMQFIFLPKGAVYLSCCPLHLCFLLILHFFLFPLTDSMHYSIIYTDKYDQSNGIKRRWIQGKAEKEKEWGNGRF